jgi:small subunit ribosomal protein S7
MTIKLFNRWSTEGVTVADPGLRGYISLKPVVIPRTYGRESSQQFHKSYMSIVERFANHIYVSGHRGKKHMITSGKNVGKTFNVWNIIMETFDNLEKKTGKNPIEVFVKALENSAIREEITSFQVGGIIVRKAVITSPQRRVDLALRLMTQIAYQKSFNNAKTIADTLTEEIFAAYSNDVQNSFAMKEKERKEREAGGAR